ncbi:MAG: sulfite exporter TauE/SafE family protein [Patescibacteria group bacterium]
MDNTFVILAASSFLIGGMHALEVDHVVTVSSLSLRKGGWRNGLFWGLGHSVILIVVGLILYFFRFQNLEMVSKVFETIVALILICLALINLRWLVFIRNIDNKPHEHVVNGQKIIHYHNHKNEHDHQKDRTQSEIQSLIIGLFHGLAGSSSIIIFLIPLLDSLAKVLIYLVLFGLGTIVGMGIVALIINRLNKSNYGILFKIEYLFRALIIVLGFYYGFTTLQELYIG